MSDSNLGFEEFFRSLGPLRQPAPVEEVLTEGERSAVETLQGLPQVDRQGLAALVSEYPEALPLLASCVGLSREQLMGEMRYRLGTAGLKTLARNRSGDALGGEHARKLLDRNGVLRRNSEPAESFRRRVAKRYVRDASRSLPAGPLHVALRALSEPTGEHDLTFDWRSVFDERARRLDDGILPVLLDSLSNAKEACQSREGSPEVMLDADLPLPLAFLVGYEWRVTARLRLHVRQRTGSSYAWVEADGPTTATPTPVIEKFDREGPAVVAVSCAKPIAYIARRYAAEHSASELVTLHTPSMLDATQMRATARETANLLRTLNDRGLRKHLLIKGPVALPIMAGAASNACGPVIMPFWDGTDYVSPITVGP